MKVRCPTRNPARNSNHNRFSSPGLKAWKAVLFFLLIILIFSIPSHAQDSLYRIKRVVDVDTHLLTTGDRVRLIGVDTPEVHESKKLYRDAGSRGRDVRTIKALGKKASAFTKSLVDKKKVRLEYDQTNAYIGHRDKYGRILAYIYLMDGTFVNAEIIRQGYGFTYTHFPFK